MKRAGMPTRYITSIERLTILQSARENVLHVLQVRFQNVPLPESVVQTINSISDRALLKKLHRDALFVESVNKFEQELGSVTNGQ